MEESLFISHEELVNGVKLLHKVKGKTEEEYINLYVSEFKISSIRANSLLTLVYNYLENCENSKCCIIR